MSCAARLPSIIRRLPALCLLVLAAALPLPAWAVDTDGDGVDDAVDAFPAHAEATVDTDQDGMPDAVVLSRAPVVFSDSFSSATLSSAWNGSVSTVSTAIVRSAPYAVSVSNVLLTQKLRMNAGSSGPALLGFWYQNRGAGFYPYVKVEGTQFTFPARSTWTYYERIVPASAQLTWQYSCGTCQESILYIDDVSLRQSALVEDADDDNDGIPDSFDPAPLDPNSVAPLNGNYKGSAIREAGSVL